MIFAFVPLRALPLERRTRALERFEASAIALPLFALKAIFCVLYYEHPDAAREIPKASIGPNSIQSWIDV